ncbi:uncharacterized protein LOC136079263 [Hydra vulgaris]|uniref:Uncharacterized protein LOC136079263 n=1 Tax=Hydra vulgaris TaxID=6087 RepID=A0ABM4BPL9_HYDVU
MDESELSLNELQASFNVVKINKSAGFDDINVNVLKAVFGVIKLPLLFIFNLSITTGIFPCQLTVTRVVPVYKNGNDSIPSNYRPISILSCHHAVTDLASQILDGFAKKSYTLGLFIDLSKAFNTVDHKILLYKLETYGVINSNFKLLQNYLKNGKRGVSYDSTCTKLQTISFGVPQGTFLGRLLFLIYVNDIYLSSNMLNSVRFANDTNLFYTYSNIKTIFFTVNRELENLNDLFKSNKLSLNISKTKYILFHHQSKSDNLPLQLPQLIINNNIANRVSSLKILGIIFDEHLNWKNHITLVENKISKTIGVMHKTKHLLSKKCLLDLYYSFIHSYISYCNIAWASTCPSALKNIYIKQKQASRIICSVHKYTHSKPLLREIKALNVYELYVF